MYPFIHIGSFHLGTFGLLLWFAAVCSTWMLHRNFVRNGVDADALNVVVLTVLAGILGAKIWHELQNPQELGRSWRQITVPGASHPLEIVEGILSWFRAGFAWYGGLLAGVLVLMSQGASLRLNGLRGVRAMVRMLDLAAPAAAIGYGVGRLGCLTSGDGDYGKVTTLPWGVHIRPDALVPTPDLVQPTPVYEFLFAMALGWWLWRRQDRPQTLGYITGEYLALSGVARFLVEFVRINPPVYGPFTNAQIAALGSSFVGGALMYLANRHPETAMAPTVNVARKAAPVTAV